MYLFKLSLGTEDTQIQTRSTAFGWAYSALDQRQAVIEHSLRWIINMNKTCHGSLACPSGSSYDEVCWRFLVRFIGRSIMQLQIFPLWESLDKMFQGMCMAPCNVLCSLHFSCKYYSTNNASSLASLSSLPVSLSLSYPLDCCFTVRLSWLTQLDDGQGPVLMTTVAMPVFSTKNETVSLYRVLQNH